MLTCRPEFDLPLTAIGIHRSDANIDVISQARRLSLMETSKIPSDVLHAGPHSTLSAEEIAKAVARHKRHHPEGEKTRSASGKQKSR